MTSPASAATDAHTMTPAQRQRAYRLRRKRAITDAIGEEAQASRVTLLTLLAQDLAKLEMFERSHEEQDVARSVPEDAKRRAASEQR